MAPPLHQFGISSMLSAGVNAKVAVDRSGRNCAFRRCCAGRTGGSDLGRSTDQADFQASAQRVDVAEIPLIDFGPFLQGSEQDRRRVAGEIAEASERIGFFYLAGHGVPDAVRADLFQQMAAFYHLPEIDREEVRATAHGYRGLMSLSQDIAVNQRLFEQYRIQDEFEPDPSRDPDGIFYGPNRWPSAAPGLASASMAYFRAMTDLSHRLLGAFALGMNVAEDRFEGMFDKPLSQLSLLYYSSIPEDAEVDRSNLVSHTDEGPFTILAQGEIGGLEVRRRDGAWIAAPPIPGAFVINIGDMMMWWSNGRYISNRHRVRNTSTQERFSAPFFFNPDYDVVVEPLAELAAIDGEARYPAVKVGAHLLRFYDGLTRRSKAAADAAAAGRKA
jgi:isopenicillin N synthase-like dioxygenase